MTIEEKAKEYRDLFPEELVANRQGRYKGFVNGAEWMLNKACEYLKNQLPIQYAGWDILAEENIKQFRKAMEE